MQQRISGISILVLIFSDIYVPFFHLILGYICKDKYVNLKEQYSISNNEIF